MRPGVERAATTAERLAALLGAGVSPATAWRHLAESGDDDRAAGIQGRIAAGLAVADAIAAVGAASGSASSGARSPRIGRSEREGWRMLAAAWAVAEVSGAPLARCLGDIAEALTAAGAVERDTGVALAGPKATARLVVLLPLVSAVGGSMLGLDTLGVLTTSVPGFLCAAGGLMLILAARLWTAALIARARPATVSTGLTLDLISVGLSGGISIAHARSAVDAALARYRLNGRDRGAVERERAEQILALAARSGAAPAELLRREAARLRRDATATASAQAAALGVWLMLPLGLCVLPAFLLLAIAPAFIGVLRSVPIM